MARGTQKLPPPRRFNWKLMLGILVLGAAGVGTALAGYKVNLYVNSDPQFTLSRENKEALLVQGLVYASKAKVQRVFSTDFGHSVFSVPLAERRRRLLAIDWIEDASVSRVWPDRLVVRIRERKPVAFVSLRTGVLLIDSHGVLLEPPAQASFAFPVISGVREDDTEAQRKEHVRAFLQVQDELGYMARDVSEIDTSDLENIRIVSQVDHRVVTLLVGDGNYAKRYQNFVNHYPEIKRRSPEAKAFDLRLDDRITVKE